MTAAKEKTELFLLTKVIQSYSPIEFSSLCQNLISSINPDMFFNYSISIQMANTHRGQALIFIACIQYWGPLDEKNEIESELKRSNLLIKP